MNKYWKRLSQQYLNSDHLSWGSVLYLGMPLWFNKFFDYFQKKSFNNLTKNICFSNKVVLDVGCGIGRWCLLLKKKGSYVVGIDLEKEKLNKAKADVLLKDIKFKQMSLEKLKFNNETFDFVNSVTVLQHIPYNRQDLAVQEICRVTKKGGYISIIELIDMFDDAPHVFPLAYKDWIKKFNNNGCKLIKAMGCEYTPVLRLLRYLQYLLTRKKTINRKSGKVKISRLNWLILKIAILVSYPIESVCVAVCPPRFARHGAFLFLKMSNKYKR